jgi:hypothetical protein
MANYLIRASNWCRILLLSAAGLTRVAAAVFQIQQFKGVVLYKHCELFCQRHRLGNITDSVFDIWFFLFGAHKAPHFKKGLIREKVEKQQYSITA